MIQAIRPPLIWTYELQAGFRRLGRDKSATKSVFRHPIRADLHLSRTISLDEAEHFLHNHHASVASLRLLFTFTPECRSASLRNRCSHFTGAWKQTSPNDAGGNESFYAASFCTCFPKASSASVTSGFSLIAFASLAWRYADNCWPAVPQCRKQSDPGKSIPRAPRCGIVPTAAQPCSSFRDLQLRNYPHACTSILPATPSPTTPGCAPARRRTPVSTVCQSPLCQLSIASVCRSTDDPDPASDPSPCSPIAQSDARRAFKSHRPAAAAPAASS